MKCINNVFAYVENYATVTNNCIFAGREAEGSALRA